MWAGWPNLPARPCWRCELCCTPGVAPQSRQRRQAPAPFVCGIAVGILLYRKHVITEQPYIAQLIECMEANGLRPLPIFINGVEAHTVVSGRVRHS